MDDPARKPPENKEPSEEDAWFHRRRESRHNLTRFVWFHTIEAGEGSNTEGLGYCVDLSRHGLGLVVQDALPEKSLLMVLMVFHSNNYNLPAVCRVAHVSQRPEGDYRIGLEFMVLPPDARQFLADNLPG